MGALYINVGEIATYCCVLSGLISKGMNCHVSGKDILIWFILIPYYMSYSVYSKSFHLQETQKLIFRTLNQGSFHWASLAQLGP